MPPAPPPLRRDADIAAALALHATGRFGLVMSVTPAPAQVLKFGMLDAGAFTPLARPEYCFANRQSLPAVHRPDGAIHVFDADAFRARATLATAPIGAVETPPERAIDIDSAEALLAAAPWSMSRKSGDRYCAPRTCEFKRMERVA